MTNQYIGADNTVTNSDRAIDRHPAVFGAPDQKQKQPTQDFVFISDFPIPASFKFNGSVYGLLKQNCDPTLVSVSA